MTYYKFRTPEGRAAAITRLLRRRRARRLAQLASEKQTPLNMDATGEAGTRDGRRPNHLRVICSAGGQVFSAHPIARTKQHGSALRYIL